MPSAATGGAGGMSSSEAALANALRAVGARVSTTSLGGGSPNNSGGVNAGFSTLQNLGRVDIQEALQLYFTTRG